MLWAIVAALCLHSAHGKLYWFEEPSDVLVLTGENFTDFIEAHHEVAVEFYNPGCNVCRAFGPEYARSPSIAKAQGLNVEIAKVNCDDEREIYEHYNISIFPSLGFFRDGNLVGGFEGCPMTGEAVVAEARRVYELPPTTHARTLTSMDEVASWLFDRSRPDFSILTTLVGFVPSGVKGTPAAAGTVAAVDAAAAKMVGKVRFAYVENDATIAAYKLPTDAVTVALYKDFDEGKETYAGELTGDAISTWLQLRSRPTALLVTGHNIRRLQRYASFILHVFVDQNGIDNGAYRAEYISALRAVGYQLEAEGLVNRGEYALTIVNGLENKSWRTPFHLINVDLPCMGLVSVASDTFYTFHGPIGTVGSEDGSVLPTLSVPAVLDFVKAFLSGFLPPNPSLVDTPEPVVEVETAAAEADGGHTEL